MATMQMNLRASVRAYPGKNDCRQTVTVTIVMELHTDIDRRVNVCRPHKAKLQARACIMGKSTARAARACNAGMFYHNHHCL